MPNRRLAIPGYCDNHTRDVYDDSRNFRFVPSSRKSPVTPIAFHE